VLRGVIELVSRCIEVAAVLIIVGGIVNAVGRYALQGGMRAGLAFKPFKDRIGGSMMLGLEFLVAADIVDTVAFKPTIQSITILGFLVLIRTFLSWSLVVEMESRWPWQPGTGRSE
jgi:uncharacterized membrane protein